MGAHYTQKYIVHGKTQHISSLGCIYLNVLSANLNQENMFMVAG